MRYWSSTYLLSHGENPYSADLMTANIAEFVWLFINMILLLTAGLMLTSIYMQTASPRATLTFLVFWGLVACTALIKKEQWVGQEPF